MAGSIRNELEELEKMGRVTASGRRPVHAEFGFEELESDDAGYEDPGHENALPEFTRPEPAGAPAASVASSLDNAWARLKRTINPE